jgi:hypothetical protein
MLSVAGQESVRRWSFCLLAVLVCAGVVLADQRCPACGTVNSDEAQFCKSCGTRLEARPAGQGTAGRISVSATVLNNDVTITSQPSGAEVEVDGAARGKTPLELRGLSMGRHNYRVTLPGYRSQTGSFTVTVQTGTIVVTTEPSGAQVFLDGALQGRTGEGGLPLMRVSYGRHTVKARLEGYNDVTKSVDLRSSEPYGVVLRLGWGKGFLRVISTPESAAVMLENRAAGTTPYFAELAPERYVLALTKRGFAEWIGYAEVYQAETATVRVALERIKTRKLPFLVAGAAGLAAGGASAYLGEQSYAKYRSATTPEDARKYRADTETWDLSRNVALGAGVAFGLVWLLVKW